MTPSKLGKTKTYLLFCNYVVCHESYLLSPLNLPLPQMLPQDPHHLYWMKYCWNCCLVDCSLHLFNSMQNQTIIWLNMVMITHNLGAQTYQLFKNVLFYITFFQYWSNPFTSNSVAIRILSPASQCPRHTHIPLDGTQWTIFLATT